MDIANIRCWVLCLSQFLQASATNKWQVTFFIWTATSILKVNQHGISWQNPISPPSVLFKYCKSLMKNIKYQMHHDHYCQPGCLKVMAQCKTAISSVLMHWRYNSLAPSHRNDFTSETSIQGSISTLRCHLIGIGFLIIKEKTVSQVSGLYNGKPYTWKDGLYIEIGPIFQSVL